MARAKKPSPPKPKATPANVLSRVADSLEVIANSKGKLAEELRRQVKAFYDRAKEYEHLAEKKRTNDAALPELVVDGFQPEQIWAALELQNGPLIKRLGARVKRLAEEVRKTAEEEESEDEDEQEDGESGGEEDEDDLEGSEEGSEIEGSDEEARLDGDEDDDDNDEDEDLEEDIEDEDLEQAGEDEGDEFSGSEEDEDDAQDLDQPSSSKQPVPRKKSTRDTSAVDDAFFHLEEMERFAEEFEAKDIKRSKKTESDDEDEEPEFDLGMDPDEISDEDDDEEDEDGEGMKDIMYSDFFDPLPASKPSRTSHDPDEPRKSKSALKKEKRQAAAFADADEDDDYYEDEEGDILERRRREEKEEEELAEEMDETEEASKQIRQRFSASRNLLEDDDDSDQASDGEDPTQLSTFEKEQRKIKQQIQELEDEAMAGKYWALKGEVVSKDRPMNSLLEEALEVDVAAKPAPVITEESTRTLEDLIVQRIKDNLFDDVERRVDELALLQARGAFDPNRDFELSDEKSKQGLGEIYESEYLKQVSGNRQTEKDAKLQKQHVEIDGLMKQLFSDLDALSNWHYVPKAPKAELEVQAQTTPALEMEEVVPLAVSDAQLAAPEEVYDKPRTERGLKDATELTSEEKKRLRAAKKREHKASQQKAAEYKKLKDKVNPGKIKKVVASEDKKAALKMLSKQRNVTIIADGKASGDASGKKRRANVIEKGESAKKQKVVMADANHLKL